MDIIIITGTFEIELSNSNIILFPGSRLKLNKGEFHSEKAGSEGVSFHANFSMIDAIDHIVLTSSNLENTLNFYCRVLGMQSKKEVIKEDVP